MGRFDLLLEMIRTESGPAVLDPANQNKLISSWDEHHDGGLSDPFGAFLIAHEAARLFAQPRKSEDGPDVRRHLRRALSSVRSARGARLSLDAADGRCGT